MWEEFVDSPVVRLRLWIGNIGYLYAVDPMCFTISVSQLDLVVDPCLSLASSLTGFCHRSESHLPFKEEALD